MVGLLGAGLIGWMLLSRDKAVVDGNVATVDGSTSNSVVDMTSTQSGGIREVESIDGLQGSNEEWLKQADYYLDLSTSGKDPGRKLTLPEDDSAWGFYRKVLEKDPANARALKGIQDIADYYAKSSYQLCDKEQYASCGAIVRQGLVVEPSHPLLKQLDEVYRTGEAGEKVVMSPKPN